MQVFQNNQDDNEMDALLNMLIFLGLAIMLQIYMTLWNDQLFPY